MSGEYVRSVSTERGAGSAASYVSTVGEDGVLHVVADCRNDEAMAARIVQAMNERPRLLRTIGRLLKEIEGCRAGHPPEDPEVLLEARSLAS